MFYFLLRIFQVDIADRKAVGYLEGWLSVAVNLFIAGVKLIYGLISSSISLLADAAHSLSDVLSSVIVLFAFKYSTRAADIEHPFGHRRIENIASIIIATLLFVVGLEFIKDSVERLLNPYEVEISTVGLVIVTITILFKEFLARFSIFLGKEINAAPLIAEGQHHRSDALSTVVVIIGLVGNKYGFVYADGIAGIIISLFIFHTAWDLLKDSSQALLGKQTDPEIVKYIKKLVEKYEKIYGVHDIIVHDFGDLYNISFHVEVPDDIDIVEAHEIADRIEKEVAAKYKGHIVVHIDPVNTSHPKYYDTVKFLREELAKEYPFLETAHDIRFVGDEKFFNLVFDVNMIPDDNTYGLLNDIRRIINEKTGANDVSINIDLPFVE